MHSKAMALALAMVLQGGCVQVVCVSIDSAIDGFIDYCINNRVGSEIGSEIGR